MLESSPLDEIHEKYSKFIDSAKQETFGEAIGDGEKRPNFIFSQFLFDSIVLVSGETNDPYNIGHFIFAVSNLLELSAKAGMPLRGAVAYGNFLADDERNIFVSEAFPRLVRFEGSQEWAGCVIMSCAEEIVGNGVIGEKFNDPKNQTLNSPILKFKVPLKNGLEEELFAINYLVFLSSSEREALFQYLSGPKRENTIKFFEKIKALNANFQYLEDAFYPAVRLLPVASRTGVRLLFADGDNEPCLPGVSDFTIRAVGRWY